MKLPGGNLVEDGRRVCVSLPLGSGGRARLRATLDEMADFDKQHVLLPDEIHETDDAVELAYPAEEAGTVPLSALIGEMRAMPAAWLPTIVDLGRFVAACADALAGRGVLGPVTIRYSAGRVGPWRLLVVPLVEVTLGDWARSSPDAWLWTSPLEPAPGYAVGAALHHALVGDLFPPGEPEPRRFARAVRGWVGAPTRLAAVLERALPESFENERTELRATVLGLLDGSVALDRERLAELATALSPHRTALRWEYEKHPATALAIMERFAATTPPERVPWEVLARLRGDESGQLDATLKALGDEDGPRNLAVLIRRLAATRPPAEARATIARAVDELDRRRLPLAEIAVLQFAHIEARYLGRDEAAERRLATPFEGWNGVLRAVILGRLHAAREQWAHVSRLCRDARNVTTAMPGGGGALGRYVVAYLDHLDGVAHWGAVQTYRDPSYLADAFQRFTASLDAAEPEDPLIAANAAWLRRIAGADATLKVGVDAYLAAKQTLAGGEATLLWYDAARILPLSGAP